MWIQSISLETDSTCGAGIKSVNRTFMYHLLSIPPSKQLTRGEISSICQEMGQDYQTQIGIKNKFNKILNLLKSLFHSISDIKSTKEMSNSTLKSCI